MTREELNTFVDLNVTNKTAPNSLTPLEEGNAIKAVADYVDQEISNLPTPGSSILKIIKVTLTSAQILDLFTNPVELVPAVAGKLLVPQFLFQKYTHETTAYATSGLFRIGLGTTSFGFVTLTPTITSADNAQGITNFSYNQSTSGLSYAELPIVIGATTANPTDGDGSLELNLTYLEITL